MPSPFGKRCVRWESGRRPAPDLLLFSQSYNYVLAGGVVSRRCDVNAARLLLMPTIVLTVGSRFAQSLAASWLAEAASTTTTPTHVFIVGIALLDFVYFGLVWGFRDWLTTDSCTRRFMTRPLADLWAGVSLISLVRDLLQSALLALERFKPWLG